MYECINKKNFKLCILFFIILFLLIRIFFSLNFYDEVFYISTALRFVNGDAMLIDEWHVTQMQAFFLYPFVQMYHFFCFENEGIIIYMRVMYIMVKCGLVFWCIFRKKSRDFNKYYFPALILLLSVPYNVFSLSYNTIAIMAAVVSIILVFERETTKVEDVLCGLCLGSVVLCNPYAIIFLIGVLGYLFWEIFVNKQKYLGKLIAICMGGFLLLVVFLLFILARADIKDVLQNLPYILNDSEHSESLISKVISFPFTIRHFLPKTSKVFFLLAVLIMLGAGKLRKTKHWEKIKFVVYVAVLIMLICDVYYVEKMFYSSAMNIWIQCIFRCGIIICLMEELNVRKSIQVFLAYIFSLSVYVCSNTSGLSYTAALIVPAFFLFANIEKGKNFEGKCNKLIIILLLGILIVNTGTKIFSGEEQIFCTNECNQKINTGPAKGLYVTGEMKERYMNVAATVEDADISSEDYVLCKNMNPLLYIQSNCKVAAYSTFAFDLEYDKLKKYYELHPERKPSMVYFNKEKLSEADQEFVNQFVDMGYVWKEINSGYIFERKSRK